jgi:hypothetical protein
MEVGEGACLSSFSLSHFSFIPSNELNVQDLPDAGGRVESWPQRS